MKKITKTTERNWQCPYCNFLNDLNCNTCKNCGAVRNGDEVEKEITTNFEETTVTETHEVSGPVISNAHTVSVFVGIAIALIAIVALLFVGINSSGNDTTKCTVISKSWEYTVSIGEYVMQTGLTSYTKPPADAENVTSKQVMQDNGWYKTEYTYDYPSWQVTRTETITGSENFVNSSGPNIVLNEDEKILETSEIHYSVTVRTYVGEEKLPVSEEKWKSLVVGNVYPLTELK